MHQTDFSHSSYRRMLHSFQDAGYTFNRFTEAEGLLETANPFVLLRHDIDFETAPALEMARLEAEMGIRSTFFFMIRSTFYSPFSIQGTRHIREILDLGHTLGLHFDCASYPEAKNEHDLGSACRLEVQMLENWFGEKVDTVSYHRPSKAAMSSCAEVTEPRPHTYLPMFTRDITYRSDSRGQWASGHPLESETWEARKPMHILVHPIWWRSDPSEPIETLNEFSQRMHDSQQLEIARNCKVFRTGQFANVVNE